MFRWILNVLIGFDQTANAMIGGNPDETLSSRAGKSAILGRRRGIIAEAAINLLFAVVAGQRNHCVASIEWDEV